MLMPLIVIRATAHLIVIAYIIYLTFFTVVNIADFYDIWIWVLDTQANKSSVQIERVTTISTTNLSANVARVAHNTAVTLV